MTRRAFELSRKDYRQQFAAGERAARAAHEPTVGPDGGEWGTEAEAIAMAWLDGYQSETDWPTIKRAAK